jgi:hypothetical protein
VCSSLACFFDLAVEKLANAIAACLLTVNLKVALRC